MIVLPFSYSLSRFKKISLINSYFLQAKAMLNSFRVFGELMLFDSGFWTGFQSPESGFSFPVTDSVFWVLGLPLAVPIQYTISDRFCQLTYEKHSCHSNCLHKERGSSARGSNKNACYTIICLNYSTCNLFCVAR